MVTLLHGSDLHFGKPFAPPLAEAFLTSVEGLRPDAIVLSGDFTQRAKRHEYEAARTYLERLPEVPVVVTPGNHDVPLYRVLERISAPYQNYREFISDELDTVTRLDGVTIVALNSAAPHHAIVNGRISPEQVDFAARAFGEPSDDIRILVTHHHLAPAPDYETDHPLPRAAELLEAFGQMGVELVLGGHLHRAYVSHSLDVYPGADPKHGIVIVHSGTTTSTRGRAREKGRNSFNLLRLGPESFEVRTYMYFEDLGRFEPVGLRRLPRRAKRVLTKGALLEDDAEQTVPVGVSLS